jgi:hypothetical protein
MLVDDWVELGQIFSEQLGVQPTLPRPHPVDVSLERIDLAVMTDIAVGMGQRPGGKRVGAESRMDQREGTRQTLILQILVVGRHLVW